MKDIGRPIYQVCFGTTNSQRETFENRQFVGQPESQIQFSGGLGSPFSKQEIRMFVSINEPIIINLK